MRFRRLCLTLAASLATLALTAPAYANLLIRIDKSVQRMTVIEDGQPIYVWPVSTGIARYDTPGGEYKPFRMEKDHFSKEWDDAPMPYSIFFTMEGHAIHGTNHTSIGRPASHGCVRLSVQHAAILWDLVKREKMANTKVVLTGEIPDADAPAVARGRPPAGVIGEDGMVTGALPGQDLREARRWREYRNGEYYYYVERPQPARRYYRTVEPPPVQYDARGYDDRYERRTPFPFSLFGR